TIIQDGLKVLILEDLWRYPGSAISDIHSRTAPESQYLPYEEESLQGNESKKQEEIMRRYCEDRNLILYIHSTKWWGGMGCAHLHDSMLFLPKVIPCP
ncbi:MAG: hypothetical protein KAI90_03015, partial [Desulfobulbaceae bacterium]|nr:hypothetical protein [Desulfobulbaceae bacterium]